MREVADVLCVVRLVHHVIKRISSDLRWNMVITCWIVLTKQPELELEHIVFVSKYENSVFDGITSFIKIL